VAVPTWFQIATFSILGVLLLVDLFIVGRRPHTPQMKEAASWVGFYVGLALVFATLLGVVQGPASATSFVAGWLTEYSLSVDNLFVFVVIMARFAVPRAYQQKVLLIGILLSLVLRGGFIAVGAEAIARFSFIFYLFGAFLLYTAVQLLRSGAQDEAEFEENVIIRGARRVLPMSQDYDGSRLTTTMADGRRLLTPMVLVFLAIGTTDVLFALDSIPAIFGLTTDPFIVYTATIFALMGLRQLYFLLGGLLERLTYLSHGLSVILGFIGVKLVLDALHENEVPFINGGEPVGWAPEIPTWASLAVIVSTLIVVTVFSLSGKRSHDHSH
jgi:tellurite resistance protein TerC